MRWLLHSHKYQAGALENHQEGFLKEMKNSRKSRSSEAVGFGFFLRRSASDDEWLKFSFVFWGGELLL